MDETEDNNVADLIILPQNHSRSSFTNLLYLLSFAVGMPAFIIVLILFSLYMKYDSYGYISRQEHKPQYQAVPQPASSSSIHLEHADGRIEALDDFFREYSSPLEGHAGTIVSEADKHNIDYRLLPAIAMQESTLCKKVIENSNNCWGFGIHSGKVKKFENYDIAIRTITATLAKKYIQKGYESPEEIGRKYTPNDTGKWPTVVNLIMTKLKDEI